MTTLKNFKEEDMPSLSWFRFQFWPKDNGAHAALTLTWVGFLGVPFEVVVVGEGGKITPSHPPHPPLTYLKLIRIMLET